MPFSAESPEEEEDDDEAVKVEEGEGGGIEEVEDDEGGCERGRMFQRMLPLATNQAISHTALTLNLGGEN